MKPHSFEEKLIWYYLIGTYGLYLLGLQFILGPALAYFLAFYLCKKLWEQRQDISPQEKISVPYTAWLWILCFLLIELTLVMSHLDFNLGMYSLVTSSIFGVAREWGVFTLFIFNGSLRIRPELIYRAVCIICLQSLIFIVICFLGSAVNLPSPFYTSPLKILGRGGSQYYNVAFSIAPGADEVGEFRFQLFAPWPPALALVGNIYFFLALQESNQKWRWIGIIGSIAMVLVSASRAGAVCIPAVLLLTLALTKFNKPTTQIALGVSSFLGSILAPQLLTWFSSFREAFDDARAGSSKVRKILGEIAVYRWWNEAPIWGHGITEYPGPKVAEGMPIGSHHTWFGLLFLRGFVGAIAFIIPLMLSFLDLLIKIQYSKIAKVALSIFLVLFVFTFVENIDVLSYLYWPGLLIIGIALKEVKNSQ